MARGKTKALRRAQLDQPGALAAFSPGALSFFLFVGVIRCAMALILVLGYLPYGRVPYSPEPEIPFLFRALAWSTTLFAILIAVEICASLPRRMELPAGRIPVSLLALVSACILAYGFFLHTGTLNDWPFQELKHEFRYDFASGQWQLVPHD